MKKKNKADCKRAQQGKVLAAKSSNLSSVPKKPCMVEGKKTTSLPPASCSLTSTHVHACRTHSQTQKRIKKHWHSYETDVLSTAWRRHTVPSSADKHVEPAKAEVNGELTIYKKNAQPCVPVSLKLHENKRKANQKEESPPVFKEKKKKKKKRERDTPSCWFICHLATFIGLRTLSSLKKCTLVTLVLQTKQPGWEGRPCLAF